MQLIDKLKENRDANYPFHMPGHKRMLAGDELLKSVYGIDITETEGFDDLHNAEGIIKEAEERCASLFGAFEAHFLVNGSTCGILAAICGSVTAGDDLLIVKNCHKSVYNAAMLSGANVHMITPGYEDAFGSCAGVNEKDVKSALENIGTSEGKRCAVVITSPTYEGITSNVGAIYETCKKAGAVFIVDAAHGAHFGFSEYFPESAVGNADVVVTSVHKTLPSMTQTALIFLTQDCPPAQRIRDMLTVFETSSPSYVMMASIDSMTGLLSEKKDDLFLAYVERLKSFRKKVTGLKKLYVPGREDLTDEASFGYDNGKIIVKDLTGSFSGKYLQRLLSERDICSEMATKDHVLLMTSIADTDEGFAKLSDALFSIDASISGGQKEKTAPVHTEEKAKYVYDMKTALFSESKKQIPVKDSAGLASACMAVVTPPGIPALLPGQIITNETADMLISAIENGLEVTGIDNGEITVIWERSST